MEVEWRRRRPREGGIFQACVDAGERATLFETEWEPNEEKGISYFSQDDDVFPLTAHFHDKAYARAAPAAEGGRSSARISASSRKRRTNQQKPKSRGDRKLLLSELGDSGIF